MGTHTQTHTLINVTSPTHIHAITFIENRDPEFEGEGRDICLRILGKKKK